VLPVGIGTTGSGAPVLQLPGGLAVDATSAAGALLEYAAGATTAAGVPLPVDCQPHSGIVFPLGISNVLCTAVDPQTHAVAVGTFPITVVDGPPVIDLGVAAGGIVAEADNALGAFVTYAVTASDAVSGPVPVECTPSASSGQPVLFPLGEITTVTCTATDSSNNQTQASFTVRVVVSWSNVLAPINPLGLSIFLRGLPIAVKFALSGDSAAITNLGARLFAARVDAAGNVGAEQPAVGAAPAVDNLFRYVPLAGQYLLPLSTAGMQAGICQLRVDLGDGVTHTARIQLL